MILDGWQWLKMIEVDDGESNLKNKKKGVVNCLHERLIWIFDWKLEKKVCIFK